MKDGSVVTVSGWLSEGRDRLAGDGTIVPVGKIFDDRSLVCSEVHECNDSFTSGTQWCQSDFNRSKGFKEVGNLCVNDLSSAAELDNYRLHLFQGDV